MNHRSRVLAAVLLSFAGGVQAQSAALYTQIKAIELGSPDRWDYVFYDSKAHRAYVAHGSAVSVVDTSEGQILGSIQGMPGGTHGIAVVADLGTGYTDDGEAGQIKVFDLKTLKVVKTIKGEPDADGMVLEPETLQIFVVNGDSGTVSVVDPRSNTVTDTIRIGSKLEAAVADGAGTVYVNGAEKRQLFRIDAHTNRVTASWNIGDCESPHGIAIDSERHRVFVSCVNQRLVVVDLISGEEIATLPIGKGTDAAGFDPVRRRIFSSNGRDGTLSVIQEKEGDRFEVIATIPTAVSGRTMDVDAASGQIFIAAAQVDASLPAVNGRPKLVPGSLKLLIFSPTP
jgi:YVTN family beta-propeller protein